MSSYISVILSLCSALTFQVNNPIYYDYSAEKVSPDRGVIQGQVSKNKELPQEFYGTWSVSSRIIKTNDPEDFINKGSDIWIFAKNGEVITLTNPVSGATASITVNEVNGKTAVFTRESLTTRSSEFENPTITIDGDNFSGTDKIIIKHFRKGKYIRTSVVEYEVRGTKISGPTLKEIFSDKS